MKVKVLVAQLFLTLCNPMDCSSQAPLWNSPGKNTAVACQSLLQVIFLIQGSNMDLLHCRRILYCLSYQGSPEGKKVLIKFLLYL